MIPYRMIVYLEDIDWTLDGLKVTGVSDTPFSQESDADINTFISFYMTYLQPQYDKCVFYQNEDYDYSDSTTYEHEAILKLYGWYKKHIDAINDINNWYKTNRANLLNNEIKSSSKTKTSDTPQDGEDYTDTYPTTQANVENSMQSKDNISFLNSLVKKYHNYMNDFVALFLKECGVYYDTDHYEPNDK